MIANDAHDDARAGPRALLGAYAAADPKRNVGLHTAAERANQIATVVWFDLRTAVSPIDAQIVERPDGVYIQFSNNEIQNR